MTYKKVDYAIEATDNEAFRLWEANHSKMEWKQNSYGYMPTVKELKILNEQGKVKLVPVCVTLTWAIVEGRTVLFYEPTSNFVDWEAVHEFVKNNLLNPGFTKTNATNAHIVFHAIQDRNEREGRGTDRVQDMREPQ
jgi:hypothetical protein